MAIRTGRRSYYRIKADQEWEMAGLARQDGDHAAEKEHTRKAREYDAMALEEEAQ